MYWYIYVYLIYAYMYYMYILYTKMARRPGSIQLEINLGRPTVQAHQQSLYHVA